MKVDTDYLRESVIAIHELSENLMAGPYSWTFNAIQDGSAAYNGASNDRDMYHNAFDFLVGNYDMTHSVLHLIWASSGILADAFTNEELALCPWKVEYELEDVQKKKGA